MQRLADLLVSLVDGIPEDAGSPAEGVRLRVARFAVEMPIEARSHARELRASLPRGRLDTGFQMPHGRLRARFEREDA